MRAGRMEIRARLRPMTERPKVQEWCRFQAMASMTTTMVAQVTSSGRRAIRC
ncbi:hypothetical protein D3C73_1661420 [compost metagenome]